MLWIKHPPAMDIAIESPNAFFLLEILVKYKYHFNVVQFSMSLYIFHSQIKNIKTALIEKQKRIGFVF